MVGRHSVSIQSCMALLYADWVVSHDVTFGVTCMQEEVSA